MNTSMILTCGILAGLGLCSAAGFPNAASAQDTEKLAAADNGFAFDLLKQLATEQPGKDIFISPFSAATALQMVANGAAGQTKTEMQQVLKTGDLPPAALNAACKSLNESLNSETNVILKLANGIWYQNNLRLKPDFVSANKDFFQAELAGVDFRRPASADLINGWADKKTDGKIQKVVQFPFPPLTRVILANAIYFKGKWAEPFDKSLTKPRDFHLAGGGVKQVPMMSQHRKFGYQEGDDFQAVRLPYAGDRLRMYLFLPTAHSNPQKLLAGFNGNQWRDEILPRFSQREGTLVFPKFKLNYEVLLNQALESMGMRQAFSNRADFSAMADEPLYVSQVKQKSYVAVDEEGTEAAAVTTVTMRALAMRMPEKPFEMTVDRPFFFVIADGRTQSILFMGIVNDPANGGASQ
jgi:serine protease inhibitor